MSDRVQAPHLLDEPPILIYPTLAVALGVNKAIVFQQLHFLLNGQKTARNRYNFVKDASGIERWWVYNSYQEWRESYFPWLSTSTLKGIFNSLEDDKLVLSMQSVKSKRDRRKWYSIDYEVWAAFSLTIGQKMSDGDGTKNVRWMRQKMSDDSSETSTETSTDTLGAPEGASARTSLEGLNEFLKALADYADGQRDVVFEATCLKLFDIAHSDIRDKDTRGRINGVAKTARSTFETAYATHFTGGWDRALEDKLVRAIDAFVKDWRLKKPNTDLPLARGKFGTAFLSFLKTYNGNGPKPKPTQISPTGTEPTPEQLAALAEARRSIRPAWELNKGANHEQPK